jgi:hypothetical protein
VSHELIDRLPNYLDDEDENRYWLTLNKTLDGSWSATYEGHYREDEESDQIEILLGGFVNDCKDLNEVYVRMRAKLERQKLWVN